MSWLTQEICEAYAGACLRGKKIAERDGLAICGNDFNKYEILRTVLTDQNVEFKALKDELLDAYGVDYFMPDKSRRELIRDIEERMEHETDNKIYALLSKELRELKGWVEKPRDAAPVINNNIAMGVSQSVTIDRHNPREVERYYQSIMG